MSKHRRRSVIWKIPTKIFREAVSNSRSIAEIIEKLQLEGSYSGFYKTIKTRIEEENIDISHMNPYYNNKNPNRTRYELEEILVKDSPYKNRTRLKERLLKEGLLKNICYKCGQKPFHNGKPLKLQLEHMNGINNDHRLENLCLLCPNCHSQTDTYAGKNSGVYIRKNKNTYRCIQCSTYITKHSKTGMCLNCLSKKRRKVERPSKEELFNMIRTHSFVKVGEFFGVSDNAIRKWCEYYNLPKTKRELKQINISS